MYVARNRCHCACALAPNRFEGSQMTTLSGAGHVTVVLFPSSWVFLLSEINRSPRRRKCPIKLEFKVHVFLL